MSCAVAQFPEELSAACYTTLLGGVVDRKDSKTKPQQPHSTHSNVWGAPTSNNPFSAGASGGFGSSSGGGGGFGSFGGGFGGSGGSGSGSGTDKPYVVSLKRQIGRLKTVVAAYIALEKAIAGGVLAGASASLSLSPVVACSDYLERNGWFPWLVCRGSRQAHGVPGLRGVGVLREALGGGPRAAEVRAARRRPALQPGESSTTSPLLLTWIGADSRLCAHSGPATTGTRCTADAGTRRTTAAAAAPATAAAAPTTAASARSA